MSQLKAFNVEIDFAGDRRLPPSGQVLLSLLDVSIADAPAISLAELRLRCGGLMPIKLQLTFDANQIIAGHRYSLAVRIEHAGRLHYITTGHHSIDPLTVFGTQRVRVDRVEERTAGIHGHNQAEGAHGGNRMD